MTVNESKGTCQKSEEVETGNGCGSEGNGTPRRKDKEKRSGTQGVREEDASIRESLSRIGEEGLMARIAPCRLVVTKTATGRTHRVTIPQAVVNESDFPLDPKEQLYARIVKDGILLTHKSDGDE